MFAPFESINMIQTQRQMDQLERKESNYKLQSQIDTTAQNVEKLEEQLSQHTVVSQGHQNLHKKFQAEFNSVNHILHGIEQKLTMSAER